MDHSNIGLFSYLSNALGSGNPVFDALLLLGFAVIIFLLFKTMHRAGEGVHISAREAELLEGISELLSTMNIQLIEMRSTVIHEFDRFNADVTFFKQELLDLQRVADNTKRLESQREYLPEPEVRDLRSLFASSSTLTEDN